MMNYFGRHNLLNPQTSGYAKSWKKCSNRCRNKRCKFLWSRQCLVGIFRICVSSSRRFAATFFHFSFTTFSKDTFPAILKSEEFCHVTSTSFSNVIFNLSTIRKVRIFAQTFSWFKIISLTCTI